MNPEPNDPNEPESDGHGKRRRRRARPRKPRAPRPEYPTDGLPGGTRGARGSLPPPELPPRPPADLCDLAPESPVRPPDYRWQLAERLADGRLVPAQWVDPWVVLAARALAAPPEHVASDPELRAALDARELTLSAGYWRRVEHEGRFLAAEPEATIAAKCGLSEPVVRAYAALGFAVADRLGCPGYVLHTLVRMYAPGFERDPGTHVRLLAHQGGPLVLDTLLEALAGIRTGPPGDPETLRLARLNIGLRITPADVRHVRRWMLLGGLFRKCKRAGVLRK